MVLFFFQSFGGIDRSSHLVRLSVKISDSVFLPLSFKHGLFPFGAPIYLSRNTGLPCARDRIVERLQQVGGLVGFGSSVVRDVGELDWLDCNECAVKPYQELSLV